MNKLQIRQLNRGQARRAFFTNNEADFPATSPGGKVAAATGAVIAAIQADAARQTSGAVSQKTAAKDEDFFKLKKLMRKMNRASKSIAEEITGVEELFRLPYGDSEEAWLAKARAFHANSADYTAEMSEYDLERDTFRDDLLTLVNRIETASTDKDIAEEERGGATGSLKAHFKELGRLGRKSDNIVKNKYEDDPKKLAEWAIASHLDAAPERGEEEDGEEAENK